MKTTVLLLVFSFLFFVHTYAQEKKGIEFGEIDAATKNKDVSLSAANISGGIKINVNGIPDAATKSNLKLKDASGNFINPDVVPTENETQKTFTIVSANFNGFANANTVSLQFFNNTTEIGKVVFTKAGVSRTPTNDLSGAYLQAFKKKYGRDFVAGKIVFNEKLNQARERKIIHIFIDDDGTFYKSSLPTTAREDNLYVFHVFYKRGAGTPQLEYEGSFDPIFEVEGTDQTSAVATRNSAGEEEQIEITEKVFGAIGPFTGSFTVKVTGTKKVLIDKTVKVAKLHHVTVNAGFYASFLRSPQNIETFVKPNGDTTLVADDPTSRGFINVMLTFYPFPRNIYFPSGDWKERFAFNVGTTISKNLSENIFAGISYDVSRGLALGIGAHYGRRSHVVDQPDFEFGEDKFSGSLDSRVKKKWDLGFYAGVTVDMRLLGFLFNPPPVTSSP